MYLQGPIVGILDVTSGTRGSDRSLHHVTAQIDLPVKRSAVSLVHSVMHVSNMTRDRLLVEDVALLAQLAAEQDVVVDRQFRDLFRGSFRRGQDFDGRRWLIGFQGLFVFDGKVLSKI